MGKTELEYIGETAREFVFIIEHDGERVGFGSMRKTDFDVVRKLWDENGEEWRKTNTA